MKITRERYIQQARGILTLRGAPIPRYKTVKTSLLAGGVFI